jgi:hypothetical protein
MKRWSMFAGWLGACLCAASVVLAQPVAPVPPPVPLGASPADLFRRILGTNEAGREAFIATKNPEAQRILRAKVAEFMALAPAAREARLQSLDLRYYLVPLMRLSSSDRARAIAALPENKRAMVQSRLLTWDILPPPLKVEVLQNESVVRLFIQAQESGTSHAQWLASLPATQREQAEIDFRRWTNLPPARREQMFSNVERFFGTLDPKSRSQALNVMGDGERAEMERTLAVFDGLPAEQRDRIVDGFRKFKDLAPAERQAFLKSADEWRTMSEKDRQLWRRIVNHTRFPINPPMPPVRAGRDGVSLVGTN